MKPVQQIQIPQHRFELLDALRGIGAIFIATLHTPPTMQRFTPFTVTYLAVDLFFCLSGFVIAFSYEDRLRKGMPLRRFMLFRLIRLYPLYLLGLILGACGFAARNHLLPVQQRAGNEYWQSLLLGIFMLPSLLQKTITTNAFPFNPPSWSLFFELVANALFAALVLAKRASSRFLSLLAGVSLAVLLYLSTVRGVALSSGWSVDREFLFGFPRIGFSFFVGVLLYRLFRSKPDLRIPLRWNGKAIALVLSGFLFMLACFSSFTQAVGYQLVMIVLCIPVLVYTAACVEVPPLYRKSCLAIGRISYPLYVLHLPLFAPLYLVQKLHIRGYFYQALAPISVILAALVAWQVCIYYDEPIRRLTTNYAQQLRVAQLDARPR